MPTNNLTVAILIKNFPSIYGTRRVTSGLKRAHHFFLSWAARIQSTTSHPISLWFILILYFHLRLGLRGDLLSSGIPIKILYIFFISPYPFWFDHPNNSLYDEKCRSWQNFLCTSVTSSLSLRFICSSHSDLRVFSVLFQCHGRPTNLRTKVNHADCPEPFLLHLSILCNAIVYISVFCGFSLDWNRMPFYVESFIRGWRLPLKWFLLIYSKIFIGHEIISESQISRKWINWQKVKNWGQMRWCAHWHECAINLTYFWRKEIELKPMYLNNSLFWDITPCSPFESQPTILE
jgi:hypothetical protein